MRESLTFVTRVMLEAMMSLVPARLVTYRHKYVLYFAPNNHNEAHIGENGIRSLLWLPAFPQNINWVIVPAVNWNIYSSLWSLPWSLDLSVDNLYHLPTSSSRQVAELGSLSSGAKMAMKTFVKRTFTIFATNASFLRVIANLQI